jgi:hypothetical protein
LGDDVIAHSTSEGVTFFYIPFFHDLIKIRSIIAQRT